MKTIEIPEKLYDKLIELAKEVKSQNIDSPNPFFQIQDVEMEQSPEGYGALVLYNADLDSELSTFDDFRKECFDHYIEELGKTEQEAEDYFDCWGENEYIDYLVDHLEYIETWWAEKKVYKNAFLTEKECERHLKANSHHYTEKAISWGSSAWRNNDFKIIHEFLNELAK